MKIREYFKFEHLPPRLKEVSQPCAVLAGHMADTLDVPGVDMAELVAGLRKLLEAKDCFVRARLSIPASREEAP